LGHIVTDEMVVKKRGFFKKYCVNKFCGLNSLRYDDLAGGFEHDKNTGLLKAGRF